MSGGQARALLASACGPAARNPPASTGLSRGAREKPHGSGAARQRNGMVSARHAGETIWFRRCTRAKPYGSTRHAGETARLRRCTRAKRHGFGAHVGQSSSGFVPHVSETTRFRRARRRNPCGFAASPQRTRLVSPRRAGENHTVPALRPRAKPHGITPTRARRGQTATPCADPGPGTGSPAGNRPRPSLGRTPCPCGPPPGGRSMPDPTSPLSETSHAQSDMPDLTCPT